MGGTLRDRENHETYTQKNIDMHVWASWDPEIQMYKNKL